jgi:hypothetical protein
MTTDILDFVDTRFEEKTERSQKQEDAIQQFIIALEALKKEDRVICSILQYVIDVAAEQFVSEGFYNRYPGLLDFFKRCGTSNEDILFLHFAQTHIDSLYCRNDACNKTPLVGECPMMYCPTCNRRYFIDVDTVTPLICNKCVSLGKECTEQTRRYAYRLFFVDKTNKEDK